MSYQELPDKHPLHKYLQQIEVHHQEVLIGSIEPKELYKDQTSIHFGQHSFLLEDLCKAQSLEQIIPFFKPAPYGDLSKLETLVDSNVRQGLEYENPLFVSEQNETPHFLQHIYQQLKSGFLSHQEFELVPFKLLCHQPGDFFLPHVDLPVDDVNMIGTLAVLFPRQISGGALKLYQRHETKQVHTDPEQLVWSAFYGDISHELNPLISGHQMIMLYHIVVKEEAQTITLSSFEEKTLSLLNEYLLSTQPSAKQMNMLLRYSYSSAALENKRFKGIDRLIYQYFKQHYSISFDQAKFEKSGTIYFADENILNPWKTELMPYHVNIETLYGNHITLGEVYKIYKQTVIQISHN